MLLFNSYQNYNGGKKEYNVQTYRHLKIARQRKGQYFSSTRGDKKSRANGIVNASIQLL